MLISAKARDLVLELCAEMGQEGDDEVLVQQFLEQHDPSLVEEAVKPGGEESMNELRRHCGLSISRGKKRQQ